MTFFQIYIQAFLVIMTMMTLLWIISVIIKNVSIVDLFWGLGFFCLAAGSWLPVLGSVLMTALIIKVSGVALLEKSLKEQKPQYKEYIEKTSSFFPWFPKK